MAGALEEWASKEVIDPDGAIEALKKEVEMLEVERAWLAGEVENLRVAQSDVENLRGKMSSLSKALEGSKAVEQLALDRAEKANETADLLPKEAEVERQSSVALGAPDQASRGRKCSWPGRGPVIHRCAWSSYTQMRLVSLGAPLLCPRSLRRLAFLLG